MLRLDTGARALTKIITFYIALKPAFLPCNQKIDLSDRRAK